MTKTITATEAVRKFSEILIKEVSVEKFVV